MTQPWPDFQVGDRLQVPTYRLPSWVPRRIRQCFVRMTTMQILDVSPKPGVAGSKVITVEKAN